MSSQRPVPANNATGMTQLHESTGQQSATPFTLPGDIAQLRSMIANPSTMLTPNHILQLQKMIGNRAVVQMMHMRADALQSSTIPHQTRIHGQSAASSDTGLSIQRKENNTGLPDQLKSNMEQISNISLDDVHVHYNSSKPAQLQAHAYAQGTDIHIAPGQEQHLGHEAWHVIQQKQGRVQTTMQLNGVGVNDSPELEHEADAVSRSVSAMTANAGPSSMQRKSVTAGALSPSTAPIQAKWISVQMPDPDGNTDWTYLSIGNYYENYETGEQYYPDTRMLDNRNESLALQELTQEEHLKMMDEIEIAKKDAFMDDESGMVYYPYDKIKSFIDSPEIRVPVDKREHYITLMEIYRDGFDLQDLFEQSGEERQIPPRKLTKGAQVGFEFQELGSQVEVYEKPEEDPVEEDQDDSGFVFDDGGENMDKYNEQAANVDVVVPTEHFGRDNKWYLVADGDNLEFVTLPFGSLDDLEAGMTELQSIAIMFANSEPDTVYKLGDTIVRVIKPDNKAQPQVNSDIPMDSVHKLVEDIADNPEMRGDLFGADSGFWKASKTEEELDMIADATTAIMQLSDEEITEAFGIKDNEELSAKAGTVKGMLQFIAQAAIHKAYFPTQLEKDQPILLKTHMGLTWMQLVEDGIINKKTAKPAKVTDLLAKAYEPLKEEKKILQDIVTKVSKGIDPVWGSTKKPVDIPEEKADDDSDDDEPSNRKQVFIELRRVPVMPIDEWLGFAVQSYRYFVDD